jgi:hypothetical protein
MTLSANQQGMAGLLASCTAVLTGFTLVLVALLLAV